MENPLPYDPMTRDGLRGEVDLIKDFFMNRFEVASNANGELIEDEDLPPKQRFPKPRLPPTGKITSPRKRPIKEQQQMAKKKRKLEEGREELLANGARPGTGDSLLGGGSIGGFGNKLTGSIRLEVPTSNPAMPDPEKDDDGAPGIGMMSPPDSM
jgi:transcriptional activator SPT7